MRGKIEEFNFRMLHHNYVLIVNPEESLIQTVAREFKMEPGDNAILTYGYIDSEVGISFEVLCMGRYIENQPIQLREGAAQTSLKIRYESISGVIMDLEFNEYFLNFYKKVKMIDDGYKSNEVAEAFRKIEGVDRFRHPQFPDDMLVFFIQDGLQTEQIWVVMLNEQFRMHPDIAKHVGKNMYGDRIVTSDKIVADRLEMAMSEPIPEEAMGLIDLSYMYSVCIRTMDGSHLNLMSALLSVRMAEQIVGNYNVAIITPYNAQSRLILAMLRDIQDVDERFYGITTATVHQFQGSEKPIVIYDVVDCFRQKYPGNLLTSAKNNTANRLFNVALTRAQGKFILVTNRDYLVSVC